MTEELLMRIQEMAARIKELERENAELRKDAERPDFYGKPALDDDLGCWNLVSPEGLRTDGKKSKVTPSSN